MKVLHIAPLWFPVAQDSPGGIETYLPTLIRALDELGCDCTLLASGESRVNAEVIPAVELNLWDGMESGRVWEYQPYEQHQLVTAIERADEYDVVHSHLGYGGLVLSAIPGIAERVLHTQHNAVTRDLVWFVERHPDLRISTVSELQAQELTASGATRVHVIPNGIDLTLFPFHAAGRGGLAYLGRMEEEKGPDIAVRVALELGLELTLAGPMSDHEFFDAEIRPQLDDRIRYIGTVDHDRKTDLLGGADCVLMPSRWDEPFGLVAAEAMACGTPVAGLRSGALPEVIGPGVGGYVADDEARPDPSPRRGPRAIRRSSRGALLRRAVLDDRSRRPGHARMTTSTATALPLASVIISNHNYGAYLSEAIDSALAQSYTKTEVIVVDDGSVDDSREIIDTYSDRVNCLYKDNGGQGSALNAGFALSRGDAVCFLDADDILEVDALAATIPLLSSGAVANVRWPLEEIDRDGRMTGQLRPERPLADGDLSDAVLTGGPDTYVISPTSGNVWSRGFLEQVMPMPERQFELCADAYLFGLAPLYGEVRSVPARLGRYRVHGANSYSSLPFDDKLTCDLRNWESRCEAVAARCRALGIDVDLETWRAGSWFHRLARSVDEVCGAIPTGSRLVLIDEDEWAVPGSLRGRQVTPLPERDGRWWGRPTDDEAAVSELERLEAAGADYAVVAWPAFWWLEHYPGLEEHLRRRRCVLENERIKVFERGR
jgi:glycosyltransferase involved in cell wall biosynthesis